MTEPRIIEARPKRDTHNPCAVCGWAAHMGVHLPALTGPRKGLPFGHAYVAAAPAPSSIGERA